MIERVRTFVDAYQLRSDEKKLLVAVSGGVDSMVLVDVLRSLNCQIELAHMNYGLRGKDSDGDEQLIRDYADSHSLMCHVRKVSMEHLEGESIQMAARTKRYAWFDELINEFEYDYVLTAHHLNDSLETTLLNLAKGTGIKGLTGISEKNGKILRPFIGITKDEILAYAQSQGLTWREDVSNSESKYMRNKIRNKVVPVLQEINPSLLDTFRSTNERLIGVNQLVEREVEMIKRNHLKEEKGQLTLDLSWYRSHELDDVLLFEILKDFGANYVVSKEIGRTDKTGAVFITDHFLLSYDRGKLLITQKPILSDHVVINSVGSFDWGSWSAEVAVVNDVSVSNSDQNIGRLDLGKLNFPLTIRSWEEGDKFVPLGMTGKKKVSDFMIDNKIPLTLKKDIPLFVSEDRIFWVGGHRIDDRFKITDQTTKVLQIKISRRD